MGLQRNSDTMHDHKSDHYLRNISLNITHERDAYSQVWQQITRGARAMNFCVA
jgi:hypothetical protein